MYVGSVYIGKEKKCDCSVGTSFHTSQVINESSCTLLLLTTRVSYIPKESGRVS